MDNTKKGAIIQTENISKSFSRVRVLNDINFSIASGEVHCIVGENGAGKSTFIKILSGAYQPECGTITIDGKDYDHLTPKLSQELGIHVIYQENILVGAMSVAENIYVGHEFANKGGWLRKKELMQTAKALIDDFGIQLNPAAIVETLSAADQQFVKILKAIAWESRVLIMDEPTSMFNTKDVQKVLDLVKNISDRGIAVIYISHHLKEIVQIADFVTVLRDGNWISTYDNPKRDIDLTVITKDMVGRSVDTFYQKEPHEIGEIQFEIQDIRLSKNSPPASFFVRKGEILGVAGMVGSGRTELVKAIFGADKRESGKVLQFGKPVNTRNPTASINSGIALINEDRQHSGLSLTMSIVENMSLVDMCKTKGFWYSLKKTWKRVQQVYKGINIKAASPYMQVQYLSGGNQQKVVIGKWLMVDSDLIILDEPTRGIDVNAKAEIYKLITRLAKEGKSIIMISSEMPELIAMSDRVIVMRKNQIVGEIEKDDINEESIISKALEVEIS